MNGHDRRVAATKDAIKDAMLTLIGRDSFGRVTVAALCREAGVGRATFYAHYAGLTQVLDELADDAISAAKPAKAEGLSGIAVLAAKMRETLDPAALAPYMDLLPVCQRVADHPKYRALFTDPFVSEYMMTQIYRRERSRSLPYILAHYNVTAEEADKLLLFGIAGAFAVNRSMGWKKDEEWYRVQKVLLSFLEGAYHALDKP